MIPNLAIILLEYHLFLVSNIIHHNLDDHICAISHNLVYQVCAQARVDIYGQSLAQQHRLRRVEA